MNNKLMYQAKRFMKKNSSTILTCVGAAGTVATAIMAVKATPKALALLEVAKEEKGEELTKWEVVKAAGPVYIPAVVTGAATVAAIFGANTLNKRQQASLMSAYALLDKSYKEYKGKVEDLYGKEVDAHVEKEIAKDKFEENPVEVTDENNKLFYDTFSRRYFESTIDKVQRAEYNLNRNIVQRDYAYVNEFYEDLGMEPIDGGWDLGWSRGSNLDTAWQEWMDFNHEKVELDDGLECIIVSFYIEPVMDFYDYV